MIHRLKTVQPYYDAVAAGMKTFDIRAADRRYEVGDLLILEEYVDLAYTGRDEHRIVTYVMSDPQYVLPGSVVLGIRDVQLGDPPLEELEEQLCVFCAIVAGRAPATVVEEWDDALAIVPLGPVVDGHVLIIPKRHVSNYTENPRHTGQLMARVAEYGARHRSSNVITSMGKAATQSVFHLHIHVVPRSEDDQLMVPWGTIYGDNPQAPHWCRVAQGLREALLEVQAVQQELNDSGNPILQSAAGRLNGIKAHLWTPEELAARGIYRG
jgi:histidine triad (HIT) family protein